MYETILSGKTIKGSYNELCIKVRNSSFLGGEIKLTA